MLFVVFFKLLCVLNSPSVSFNMARSGWLGSVPPTPPCLHSFCTFLLLQSCRVSFRLCFWLLVCVCVYVHTCMHEHYVSCCLASGTFLTDSWSRDGSAPAGLELNRLEVLLLPASPYCHTTVFHFSFQRRSVGCDMKMSICLCGYNCEWVSWKWKHVNCWRI